MAYKKYKYSKSYSLPDGRRKNIRANTKEEFERKCFEFERDRYDGLNLGDDTTVVELAQRWFDNTKKPYLRPSSLSNAKFIVNQYILKDWFAVRPVRDVKVVEIDAILSNVAGLSKSTQSKVLMSLRGIFDYAVDNNIIRKSPIPKSYKLRGKSAPKKREPLTPEQTKQLLAVTEGTRAHLPVAIILGLGLRRGEVCGLRWQDIDFTNHVAHIRNTIDMTHGRDVFQEHTKTSAGVRDIPIPDWLFVKLKEEKKITNSMFICSQKNGNHHTYSSWTSMWDIIVRRERRSATDNDKHTNCPRVLDFHCCPHQLRHTCITRWIEAGLPFKAVQYMAGHSTIDMTLSVYTHYDRTVNFQKTQEVLASLDPRVSAY